LRVIRELIRLISELRDFAVISTTSFAGRCFQALNPQTCLATNWHLEVIAAKLTEVRKGKIRRLIINIPYLSDFTFIIFHPTCRRRSNSA
jgi:hypothetical protein